MKNKLGLIGKSLSHSFSKSNFNTKFQNESIRNFSYELIEIEEEELENVFNHLKKEFLGINVTIPYKEKVIALLDEMDIHAEKIGAVNCILFKNGRSKGYNTDYLGFAKSIEKESFDKSKKALIIGSGGASKAISYALKTYFNLELEVVSRDPSKGLLIDDLTMKLMNDYSLIVNTTPLGMYPNLEDFPSLPYQFISSNHFCVDLIYNPLETNFLKKCKEQGALILNGQKMLENQAELSFEIWKNNL